MPAISIILLTAILLFLGFRLLLCGRRGDLRGRIERIFHDELVRRSRKKEDAQ